MLTCPLTLAPLLCHPSTPPPQKKKKKKNCRPLLHWSAQVWPDPKTNLMDDRCTAPPLGENSNLRSSCNCYLSNYIHVMEASRFPTKTTRHIQWTCKCLWKRKFDVLKILLFHNINYIFSWFNVYFKVWKEEKETPFWGTALAVSALLYVVKKLLLDLTQFWNLTPSYWPKLLRFVSSSVPLNIT